MSGERALAVDVSNPSRIDPDVTERRVNAWIGQGVTIEGRIRSTQDLRIDGRVEGTLDLPQHELVLGAGAEVHATVHAKSVLVGGTIVGDIVAAERVQIQETGSVQGDVTAARLLMFDGASLCGKIAVEGSRTVLNDGNGGPDAARRAG
jgi:cytoskeletal protein CcmA (bactofilin family)